MNRYLALSQVLKVIINVLKEIRPQDNSEKYGVICYTCDNATKTITVYFRLSLDEEHRQLKDLRRNHYDSFIAFLLETEVPHVLRA